MSDVFESIDSRSVICRVLSAGRSLVAGFQPCLPLARLYQNSEANVFKLSAGGEWLNDYS